MPDFSSPAAEAMEEIAESYCVSFDIGGGGDIEHVGVAV
jgi:hypothetical protein